MSYVVSGLGAAIIEYEMDFSREAKKRGLRSPFKVRQDLFAKRCSNGVDEKTGVPYMSVREATPEEKALEPSKAEIANYIKERELFIATKIYEERGYPDFIRYVDMNKTSFEDGIFDELIEKFIPCESVGGQCDMVCKFFKAGCIKEQNK